MENVSFFDFEEEKTAKKPVKYSEKMLDVVKMNFEQQETLTWRSLFEGFDELHAITYSSGIQFVCELIKSFSKAEIIFGYDGVLTYSFQEVMAFQSKTIGQ